MATYTDILIQNEDIAIDGDNQAVIIEDRAVILQDLVHAIRESGYLVEMIAERGAERRGLLRNKIIDLVEEDTRIVPGTVKFTGSASEWTLFADTYEFGPIQSPVWIN